MGAALLGIALAPLAAGAQNSPDRSAEAAYERGLAALRSSRFGDAALALEDSYRLSPVPGVLFNLALAYRGAGRHIAAVDAFTRYLRDEASVPRDRRAAVERAVAELRAGLATVDCAVTPSIAAVTVDGRASRCDGAIVLDPGQHELEARAEGYTAERRSLRLDAGGSASFRVQLSPILAALPPYEPPVTTSPPAGPVVAPAASVVVPVETPHPRERATPVYARWWFWTLVGAAVVGGVVLGGVLASGPSDPRLGTVFDVEAIRAR